MCNCSIITASDISLTRQLFRDSIHYKETEEYKKYKPNLVNIQTHIHQ